MNVTYTIPAENREAVTAKLETMNRKAAKLGTAPISVTFAHSHIQTWKERIGDTDRFREFSREWLTATVDGATAEIAGYYFRAALHHTTEGNILASVPGYEVPREYRNAPSACHHCGTVRRRSTTFLLESKDGVVQVGRNCLQDFLGGNDPHAMASWAEALGAFDSWFRSLTDEDGQAITRAEPTFALGTYLLAVAAVIRKDGWVSRKLAQESELTATADVAWRLLSGTGNRDEDKRLEARYGDPSGESSWAPEDWTTRRVTLEWIETLDDETNNDYLHNLAVVGRAGLVNRKTSGLAASMVSAAKRATKQAETKAEPSASTSVHVGALGERLRGVPVTLVGRAELPPTEFGTRMLVRLADNAGNVFVWFTGGDALYGRWDFGNGEEARDMVEGDMLYMTGTVKRHGEFGGVKQTEMSRCVLSTKAPEPKKKGKGKKTAQPELGV
jgi:hypothetical protein